MMNQLLLKGFEVELFTGSPNGQNVGVAVEVTRDLHDFVKEPDHRNIEYITSPIKDYALLSEALLAPRRRLREWLSLKNLTILPGSTLSLGDSERFERSDPVNPYHDLIEATYGTRVVTASIHINLGIEDLSVLFAALRLVRCEAALFLALSASSPFLNGLSTGMHSQRWVQFPLTPLNVPLFANHGHYVSWVEEQLETGNMTNERHFWTSVRPNGPKRPYQLNRLELRICDLITDTNVLLAVTALLELRVLSIVRSPNLNDPFLASQLDKYELAELSNKNDVAAAEASLNSTLHHWRDGSSIVCREWLDQILEEVTPLAVEMGLSDQLKPLYSVITHGNQAMQWLEAYSTGQSVEAVLQKSIVAMQAEETFTGRGGVMLG
nr:glutamate--cysteine ligase [Prochlorococcus sp. MIT 1300]